MFDKSELARGLLILAVAPSGRVCGRCAADRSLRASSATTGLVYAWPCSSELARDLLKDQKIARQARFYSGYLLLQGFDGSARGLFLAQTGQVVSRF